MQNTEPLIRPFPALYPHPEWAQRIVAPPYDVVEKEDVSAIVKGNPYSFLAISRPDALEASSPGQCRRRLEQWIAEGKFLYHPEPAFYLYRIRAGSRVQLGVVAEVSLRGRKEGRILPHEETRPDKVADRLDHLKALGANSGPAYLIHAPKDSLHALLLDASTRFPPLFEVEDSSGANHALWILPSSFHQKLEEIFSQLDRFYIADGHHRSLSAFKYWEEQSASFSPTAPEAYFLGILFSSDEVEILPYHRFIVTTPYGDPRPFLDELKRTFPASPLEGSPFPDRKGRVGAVTREGGLFLELRSNPDPSHPVKSLDSYQLNRQVLEPYLRISDLRLDSRCLFFGGERAGEELRRLFSLHPRGVAFTLYPVAVEELMRVVDAGSLMPPKSTWFHPKLLDGMVIQPFSSWRERFLKTFHPGQKKAL